MVMTFRPALKSEAKPLVGLYAESGKGKTTSALLLACGFVGGDMSQVGMIETESGRGEALADHPVVGGYRVLPLRDDFSPKAYGAAITAAEKAGLRALIIDSASHEWEGAQGVLAQAAENQADGKKGPIVWQQPKISHARDFMLRLLQTPISLVVICMRAKYPMMQVTEANKQQFPRVKVGDWVRSEKLEPKQAEDILYELFIHGWIDDEHRFHGTKYTLDELREVIRDGERITVDSGRRLAEWARGGSKVTAASPQVSEPARPDSSDSPSLPCDDQSLIPADAAPIDAAEFLGETVDTETGEIAPPPGKPIMFTVPNKRPTRVASVEDWRLTWEGLCAQVIHSSKLSPAEKEAKIRLLKQANNGNIRSIGATFTAEMNSNVARKVQEIHATPGGSSKSDESTANSPTATPAPSAS